MFFFILSTEGGRNSTHCHDNSLKTAQVTLKMEPVENGKLCVRSKNRIITIIRIITMFFLNHSMILLFEIYTSF